MRMFLTFNVNSFGEVKLTMYIPPGFAIRWGLKFTEISEKCTDGRYRKVATAPK